MNILILANAYPPLYMGGESAHVWNLSRGLTAMGHNIIVVHPYPSANMTMPAQVSKLHKQPSEQVQVYQILINAAASSMELLNNAMVLIVDQLIGSGHKIDLIHCHSNRFAEGAIRLTQTYNIPLVVTIHAIHIAIIQDLNSKKSGCENLKDSAESEKSFDDTQRFKLLCSKADRIIAISHAMARLIRKFYGAQDEKLHVIHNGTDVDKLSGYPGRQRVLELKQQLGVSGKTVVMFAGRIEPVKGIESLAAACKHLCASREDVAFLFVGNGSGNEWLRSYLQEVTLAHFVTWQSFDMLIPYYHLADIVAVPSLIEPFGLVAVEAMACGACVVASDADGLDEIIEHGVNGIKVRLEIDADGDRRLNPASLTQAIEYALTNSKMREIISANAKITAFKFSLATMARETADVYNSAVEAKYDSGKSSTTRITGPARL